LAGCAVQSTFPLGRLVAYFQDQVAWALMVGDDAKHALRRPACERKARNREK
jgi:hypothetical protein